MVTVYSLASFKRKMGYKPYTAFMKRLRYLQRVGAIEIQQSGFHGDSLHHHKLVVIRDEERTLKVFENHVQYSVDDPPAKASIDIPILSEEPEPIFDFCGFLERAISLAKVKSFEDIASLHLFLADKYADGYTLNEQALPYLLKKWLIAKDD